MTVKNAAAAQPAVVVTGASSGIGLEIARVAAREATVVLIARSHNKLIELAAEIAAAGGTAHVLPLDLASGASAAVIERFLSDRGLYCDALVNNAGYGLVGPAAQLDSADQLGVVDLNIRALTELTLAFLPGMVARGRGGVLNVASTASFQPGPYMAIYYASKAFVRSFSEALWEENHRRGVVVTALCPGPVDTPFFKRAAGKPRLFRLLPNDDARAVAEEGWRGFRAGRRVVITGFVNKTTPFLIRLLPARLVLWFMGRMQGRRFRSAKS